MSAIEVTERDGIAAHLSSPLGQRRDVLVGLRHARERSECLRAQEVEELRLVRYVMVERRRADAEVLGKATHGQLADAATTDDVERSLHDGPQGQSHRTRVRHPSGRPGIHRGSLTALDYPDTKEF